MEIQHLPERRYCVRRHHGPVDTVDETRRPMYQHMISHELVGGASALRYVDDVDTLREVDVLIEATCNFRGDDTVRVEVLPGGTYAVMDWSGPVADVPAARRRFLAAVHAAGHTPVGAVLQVHLMDAIDGETEQSFQMQVRPGDAGARPKD